MNTFLECHHRKENICEKNGNQCIPGVSRLVTECSRMILEEEKYLQCGVCHTPVWKDKYIPQDVDMVFCPLCERLCFEKNCVQTKERLAGELRRYKGLVNEYSRRCVDVTDAIKAMRAFAIFKVKNIQDMIQSLV